MAITFDTVRKHIVLDSTDVSAAQIWTAWVDWQALNQQWPLAFSLVGGIALGGGLFIPPYFFLLNGWRVRPMEANQTLIITGNLFVDGGGVPIVQTLGVYNVSAQYTVPVQAQGISTGGSSGATPSQVWAHMVENSMSAADLLRLLSAVAAGKTTIVDNGGGLATVAFRDLADTKNRLVAEMNGSERTDITLDLD